MTIFRTEWQLIRWSAMVTVLAVSILIKGLFIIIFVLVVSMLVVSRRCWTPLVALSLLSVASSGGPLRIFIISTTLGFTAPTRLLCPTVFTIFLLRRRRSSCRRLSTTLFRNDPFRYKIELPLNLIDVFASWIKTLIKEFMVIFSFYWIESFTVFIIFQIVVIEIVLFRVVVLIAIIFIRVILFVTVSLIIITIACFASLFALFSTELASLLVLKL